jgi:hypothetical protein
MTGQWVDNGRKQIQFTVLGSCGAYVSAKVSFDQPIFDVWLASTLEDTDMLVEMGKHRLEWN